MSCSSIQVELGAFVLGGLDAPTTDHVAQHLVHCDTCRAEHASIAGLPALLDLVGEAPPPVPARVRDHVVAAAVQRRDRGRWMLAVACAAILAAALGGLLGWRLAPVAPGDVAVRLDTVEPSEATGWATVRTTDGRLVMDLEIEGLEPLGPPAVYEAWVSRPDGGIASVGQLQTGPGGRVSVTVVADGPPEEFRGFWITAEPDGRDPAHDGPTVLRSAIPPAR